MKYRLLLTLALFDYYTRLGSYKSSIYINNSRYGMFYTSQKFRARHRLRMASL